MPRNRGTRSGVFCGIYELNLVFVISKLGLDFWRATSIHQKFSARPIDNCSTIEFWDSMDQSIIESHEITFERHQFLVTKQQKKNQLKVAIRTKKFFDNCYPGEKQKILLEMYSLLIRLMMRFKEFKKFVESIKPWKWKLTLMRKRLQKQKKYREKQ